MDDINLNFIDDDFEFNEVNLNNPLFDKEEKEEQIKDEVTPKKIEKPKEVKEPIKINNKPKKNTEELSNEDILDDIYDTLEGYSKLVEKINEKNKELEMLKFDYKKIKDENDYLTKKYKNVDEEKISLDIELRRVKNDLAQKEKKVLMLKTLLQLIIREYGNKEITRVTRINIDQLKDFLN